MVHVLAMLHAGASGLIGLRAYESAVLPILSEYGGQLLSAFVPEGHDQADCPDEIHLIEFESREGLQSFRQDERVVALADKRRTAIASTVTYVSEKLLDYRFLPGQ